MADEQIIVLVTDKDDDRHGEISVLDDPHKAERLVEALLEAGFEQKRIRVFLGRTSEFQVSHRPVVALVSDEAGTSDEAAFEPPQPVRIPGVRAEDDQPVTAEALNAAGEIPEDEDEAAPVRFSSLFRSA